MRLPRIPRLCQRKDGRLYATDPHLKKPIYFKTPDDYEVWRRDFLARIKSMQPEESPLVLTPGKRVTVAALCTAYLDFAHGYYRKDGRPTSEVDVLRMMIRHLDAVAGERQADSLRPRDVDAVLQHMIDADLSRRTINQLLRKIKTMYRWAVRQEVVTGETLGRILSVDGLKKGRTAARELPKVKPVAIEALKATLPGLRKPVQDMIWVQFYGAMRPGEVIQMTAASINTEREPWEYVPASHKTEHHHEDEDESRRVFLGPKAREILAPYLRNRKEPKKPFFLTKTGRPWTVGKYRCVVYEACERLGVKRWSPHQLRHAMATAVRKQYGAEAARVFLGQENLKTTEIYAEEDQDQSRKIAEDMG